jgi:hypothetical protein
VKREFFKGKISAFVTEKKLRITVTLKMSLFSGIFYGTVIILMWS